MNNLENIISMVGEEKTLIIACGEYGLSKLIRFTDNIFLYALPESMLHNHDPLEKGQIQSYVECVGCKQLVIVGGSGHQHLIQRLVTNKSNMSPAAALKFNMKVFLRNQDKEILSEPLRDQMLVELHIINQCSMLMDYYFIRERVDNSQLQIKGFVIADTELIPIFHNGIIYNNIISMN